MGKITIKFRVPLSEAKNVVSVIVPNDMSKMREYYIITYECDTFAQAALLIAALQEAEITLVSN